MSQQPYDVFISYARDDAARAQIVRERLEGLGLHVFFDAEGIDSGQEFPVVIDRAVKTAKCVLGLWSQNAFDGRWVRIESRIGLDQGKLVAAVIDGTRPEDLPAEFYNVNIENLSDFRGQADHQAWNRVLRAIGRRVGRELGARPAARPQQPAYGGASAQPQPQTQAQGGAHNGIIWAIGGALAAAVVLLLVLRNSDNSTPAAPPTAIESADGQASGGLAIPVPKPDDPSPGDNAAREAARIQRACEGGDIAACSTYVQRYPGSDFSRIAAQRATAGQPAADAGGVVWQREAPAPVAADLSGRWQGYYQQGENRTPFAVQIDGRTGAFRGRMAETNTFADPARFPQLFANVVGQTRADGAVAFVKTYDGTAGQSHSVEYQGRIDDGGQTISGTWRIRAENGQELSGPFRMQRQ
ncbi:MAG: toll/interleukin-1 receptor domain-containing protein [Hyphomonadaceae bacterium]|nr:toll/interleukin-1 receptor domain-containing protein [Hyphomonadaceae bacterium]